MSDTVAGRRAQGLPDHVTDLAILARLAALLVPRDMAKARRARGNKKISTFGGTPVEAVSEVGHDRPATD